MRLPEFLTLGLWLPLILGRGVRSRRKGIAYSATLLIILAVIIIVIAIAIVLLLYPPAPPS